MTNTRTAAAPSRAGAAVQPLTAAGSVLYGRAHSADRELRLVGHDVRGLQVSVIHRIFKRCSDVGVFVARVAIEGDFWSSPVGRQRENPERAQLRPL